MDAKEGKNYTTCLSEQKQIIREMEICRTERLPSSWTLNLVIVMVATLSLAETNTGDARSDQTSVDSPDTIRRRLGGANLDDFSQRRELKKS